MINKEHGWALPKEALEKMPVEVVNFVKPNNKGIGVRFMDSDRGRNAVRIDKGDLHAGWAHQRVDHVRINYNGQVIGKDGYIISDSLVKNPGQHPDAHIPYSDWIKWKYWYKP